MTDKYSADRAILDEIMSEVRFLTEDLQKDILDYVRHLKEPRSYPRVNKPVEMDVLIGDKVIQSDARNLSASGVFIKSGMNPQIGTAAKVVFSLPGQARPFKLAATVVRTDASGIGLCFSQMTSYARQHLDNLLKGLGAQGND